MLWCENLQDEWLPQEDMDTVQKTDDDDSDVSLDADEHGPTDEHSRSAVAAIESDGSDSD